MEKSPDAFRTISEVADLLDVPAHVLRFWESRFPQVRPVKRAGGRRYYRPTDVALLGGIRLLLHDQGLTIRGVQKILREQGVRHVCALADQGLALDARQEWVEEEAIGLPVAPVVEDRVIPWPGPRKAAEAEAIDDVAEAMDDAAAVPPTPGPEAEIADASLEVGLAPVVEDAAALDDHDIQAEPAVTAMGPETLAPAPDLPVPDLAMSAEPPAEPSHDPADGMSAGTDLESSLVAEPDSVVVPMEPEAPGLPAEPAIAPDAAPAAAPERHPFEGLPLFMQPPAPVPAAPRTEVFRPREETLPDLPALAARLRRWSPAPADRPQLRDITIRLRQLRDRVDQGQPGRE